VLQYLQVLGYGGPLILNGFASSLPWSRPARGAVRDASARERGKGGTQAIGPLILAHLTG
jgi:hypothetical protein